MKKTLITIGAIGTLAGGVVITDEMVNPYTDTGASLEIRAESVVPDSGENKVEVLKESPAVTLSKWNGEAALTVKYSDVKGEGVRTPLTDRIEWKDTKQEVHAYPVEASAGLEDGGYEIDILLKEKPDTNVFTFDIENWQNLDFVYQPPLNVERPNDNCTETKCFDEQGKAVDIRPENIVGSYAVFYKDHIFQAIGGMNYGNSKAYHILRPKVTDAAGNVTWGVLSYTNGKLTVTVDPNWLATATYPVIIDPVFGYGVVGGSIQSSTQINCTVFTAPASSGNVITSMTSFSLRNGAAVGTIIHAIYGDAAGEVTTRLVTESTGYPAPTDPGDFGTSSISYAFSASQVLWLCWWSSGGQAFKYDVGAANQNEDSSGLTYPTWPSPFGTIANHLSRKMTIYATYSPNTSPPTVVTDVAYDISSMFATLRGNITDVGGAAPLERGFRYGLTTLYGATTTEFFVTPDTGQYPFFLNRLLCGTTYHYQAYASTTYGLAYGSDATVTMLPCQRIINYNAFIRNANGSITVKQ